MQSGPWVGRGVGRVCLQLVGGARMNYLPLQTGSDADVERKEAGATSIPSSPHRMDPIAYAELLKKSGNQGFKSGNFSLAIRKYDEAIQILLQLYQWG